MKINPIWAAVTALLVMTTLALCVFGAFGGVLYARTPNSPQEAIEGFFGALKAGDTEKAYELLYNFDSLGLENEPETENGRLLLEALRESYEYSLVGECWQSGLVAEQTVRITALDLEKVAEARAQETPEDAEASPAPLPPLSQVLEEAPGLTASAECNVRLCYSEGRWRIVMDKPLFTALTGGR